MYIRRAGAKKKTKEKNKTGETKLKINRRLVNILNTK